jgi:hypothetical protein
MIGRGQCSNEHARTDIGGAFDSERLKVSDQELGRKIDAMRANYDQRLERLQKGAAPKPVPRGRSKP